MALGTRAILVMSSYWIKTDKAGIEPHVPWDGSLNRMLTSEETSVPASS